MVGRGPPNHLTGSPLHRRGDLRQDPAAFDRLLESHEHVLVPVLESQILVLGHDPVRAAWVEGSPARALLQDLNSAVLLGEVDNRLHWTAEVSAEMGQTLAEERGARYARLRSVSALLDRVSAAILAHARAMAHFHAHHGYCGRCGTPTLVGGLGNWRTCGDGSCGHITFPRTDPAIITRLARGEECLLVRQPEWRPLQFATVAGFVEPGESLEEAVVREVKEEVGLEVISVTYHSSQPWPFPSGIMIGFDVEVLGEVSLDDPEIEEARWFTRDGMRAARDAGQILLPSDYSISRRLIEDWLAGDGAGAGPG